MAYYTYEAIQELKRHYLEAYNGIIYTIQGSLIDSYIMIAEGIYKVAIVKEVYKNCAESIYSLRFSSKLSKKYEKVIDLLNEGEYGKAEELFYK